MLRRHLMKLVVGLALILTLVGGAALGVSKTTTTVPAHSPLACAPDAPPCI
jgi:hypothetical protein